MPVVGYRLLQTFAFGLGAGDVREEATAVNEVARLGSRCDISMS